MSIQTPSARASAPSRHALTTTPPRGQGTPGGICDADAKRREKALDIIVIAK